MSEETEPIELEAIDPNLWLTPEGRKKAQEIADRNINKLQIKFGPFESETCPPGYVQLQQKFFDGNWDTPRK